MVVGCELRMKLHVCLWFHIDRIWFSWRRDSLVQIEKLCSLLSPSLAWLSYWRLFHQAPLLWGIEGAASGSWSIQTFSDHVVVLQMRAESELMLHFLCCHSGLYWGGCCCGWADLIRMQPGRWMVIESQSPRANNLNLAVDSIRIGIIFIAKYTYEEFDQFFFDDKAPNKGMCKRCVVQTPLKDKEQKNTKRGKREKNIYKCNSWFRGDEKCRSGWNAINKMCGCLLCDLVQEAYVSY